MSEQAIFEKISKLESAVKELEAKVNSSNKTIPSEEGLSFLTEKNKEQKEKIEFLYSEITNRNKDLEKKDVIIEELKLYVDYCLDKLDFGHIQFYPQRPMPLGFDFFKKHRMTLRETQP